MTGARASTPPATDTSSPPVRFYRYLSGYAGARMRWIVMTSALAGLSMGLTMAVIGAAADEFVHEGAVSARSALLFAACAAAYYWSRWAAAESSVEAAFEATTSLQLRLAEKLRQARFPELRRIERAHAYSMLAGSKDIIVEAARHMTTGMSGVATLVAAVVYGWEVSRTGVALIVVVIGACVALALEWQRTSVGLLRAAGEADRSLAGAVTHLVEGYVELKVHRPKRDDFCGQHLRALADRSRAARLARERQHARALAVFTASTLLPVGATVFLLPRLATVDGEVAVKLLVVSFFSLTPMIAFVGFISYASRAWVTLSALAAFERELDAMREDDATPNPQAPPFERLELPAGTFRYPDGFTMRVEGFSLRRGTVVMLTGGNGAGKTTLMRVLAGLYPLSSGEILVNGRPVSDIGLESYRSLFSAIFTDFHLFDTLWGIEDPSPERVRALLDTVGLADSVTYDDGRFSTVALSSGQRKRLALVCALLEDRQVLLFDEVAAGFDVRYRDRFYRELLPALRAAGKTVLAVSHDDRYFHVADDVLTMREGELAHA